MPVADLRSSLAVARPDVAAQWHPTANGDARPEDVTVGSHRKVWWTCPAHAAPFEQTVANRCRGKRCGFCAGQRVLRGFNDLATTHPAVAAQWHPTLNRIRPVEVTAGSHDVAWWRCPVEHEWDAPVYQRCKGRPSGCPVCTGKRVVAGVNDLATTHPHLAADLVSVEDLDDLASVSAGMPRSARWRCPAGHEWVERVASRVKRDQRGRADCRTCAQGSR